MNFMRECLFILSFILFYIKAYSQDCDCDHTILNLSANSINVINSSSFNYNPGDTFCIPEGNYAGIRLVGFKGTKVAPLKFINCGGKVTFSDPVYPGVDIKNSNYIRFTGSGDTAIMYGFQVVNAPSSGLAVASFSSDIEVDHVEVQNVGFAGIIAKTEPTCSDPATWRRNGFIMRNLNIHDNYVHDTHGEGIYIGNTNGYKVYTKMHCDGSPVFPHWLENVSVHHNKFENIGWDGIQLNQVLSNGKVFNNTVIGYGIQRSGNQDFAMSIGAGVYQIYNNYLENTDQGKGMQFISAQSGTKIFNNVLINPKSFGIFIHSRHELDDVTEGYFVMNNTIVNPEKSGVQLITQIKHSFDSNLIDVLQNDTPSYFINNVILNPGNTYEKFGTWKGVPENYIDFNTPETRDKMLLNIKTNIFTKQTETVGFEDVISNNYKPLNINSLVVNKGTDVSSYGVNFDFESLSRPQGEGFDIGAYEFKETIVLGVDDVIFKKANFYKINNTRTLQFLRLKEGGNFLQIFNILGQNVFKMNLKAVGNFNLDLPNLLSGVYIVKLSTLTGIMSKKIIIE